MPKDCEGIPIPKSRTAFIVYTNKKYVPIFLAGQGTSAQVWYAIPSKEAVAPDASPSKLINQICAVKVNMFNAEPAVLNKISEHPNDNTAEVQALSSISELAQGNLKLRFPEFLEALMGGDCKPLDSPWLAMRAVRGFELRDMLRLARELSCPLPEPLVYHLFVQLMGALEFLHNQQMRKGDIKDINIMVDIEPRNAELPNLSLPNFMFIDFEGCVDESHPKYLRLERALFYNMVMCPAAINNHICVNKSDEPEKSQIDICEKHDENWYSFVEALRTSGQYGMGALPNMGLAYMMDDKDLRTGGKLFEMAKARRLQISPFEEEIINKLVKEAVTSSVHKHRDFPNEEDVAEAIKDFRGHTS